MTQERRQKEVFLGLPLHRSHGIYYHSLGEYEKALESYKHALDLNPKDLETIYRSGLSKLLIRKYTESLEDAVKVLELDGHNLRALYLKSKALYELAEFEQALMFFHRGYKKRKQPPVFDEGIMLAEETIQDCIGPNAGPVLTELAFVIRSMQKKQKQKLKREQQSYQTKAEIVEENESCFEYERQKFDTLMTKRYLGHNFASDLFFMQKLIEHPEISSDPKQHSKDIISKASDALALLYDTKDNLRNKSPFYTYKQRTYPGTSKRKYRNLVIEERMQSAKRETSKLLAKVGIYRDAKNTKLFLEAMEKAIQFADECPKKFLPEREVYLETIYYLYALMCADQLKLSPNVIPIDRQIRIYFGSLPERTRSQDSEFIAYYHPFMDNKKILETCSKRLELAKSDLERTWLLHEMARVQLEMGYNFGSARSMARKSLLSALKLGNLIWGVIVNMMLCRIEVKCRNRVEALNCAYRAENIATRLHQSNVADFIRQTIKLIEEICVEGEQEDPIQDRTGQMMNIMASDHLKSEIKRVFSHIANQPRNRRMSVMPGYKYKPKKLEAQQSMLQDSRDLSDKSSSQRFEKTLQNSASVMDTVDGGKELSDKSSSLRFAKSEKGASRVEFRTSA